MFQIFRQNAQPKQSKAKVGYGETGNEEEDLSSRQVHFRRTG